MTLLTAPPNRYGNCYDDVFVSKLNSDLTQLLSSTLLGGNDIFSHELSHSIAIDQSGNIYITGYTISSDFPTTAGAYDPTFNGTGSNIFVSKLSSDLTQLLASTFVGAGEGRSLAIDQLGNVYVTGYTSSPDFPATPGAYDTTYGNYDVFVSKLSSDLSQLLASTFIGEGEGNSLAIDQSGNVYVVGETWSADFPTTPGAYDFIYNGGEDAFISKFDSDLTQLLASTFIGGSSFDISYSLAINSSGNVYITGKTQSSDFPTTAGAYDTTYNEIFISKFDNNLTKLLASTFIGGSDYERSYSMALDSSGNVYVTGETRSADYPVTSDAYDATFNGGQDVFVSKLDSNLSQLLASTFVGGTYGWLGLNDPNEYGNSIAIDSSGNIYVTGNTLSEDYPTTPGAYDVTHNGNWDVFISKFNFGTLPSTPSQSQGQGSGTNNQGTSNAPGLQNAPGVQTAPGLKKK
ncbi:MAG: SBBP repeat-containing protein [Deltaproteobacteria bacterium]|nr:SBBP repeat-containing protein [Deltaproteobacteria bacterium]